jgi:hypothetical protein
MRNEIMKACQELALNTIFAVRPEEDSDWSFAMSLDYDDYEVEYPEGWALAENYSGYSTSYIKESLEEEYSVLVTFALKIKQIAINDYVSNTSPN